MKTLSASGYRKRPYIHTEQNRSPVTFVWWATSPSGRKSKFLHHATFYRLRSSGKLKRHDTGFLYPVFVPTRHYGLTVDELAILAQQMFPPPKLRAGYTWHGPFLYQSFSPAPQAGFNWNHFVAMEAPKESDGIPLTYGVTINDGAIDVGLHVGKEPLAACRM